MAHATGTALECDVAVIGGGVIGCAVAYYAAKRGACVAVIERDAVGGGASSANAGGINLATKKGRATIALGKASQKLYETLHIELGCDVEYAVLGKLIIAEREAEAAFLEDMAAEQRAAGAPVEIVSSERCRELNPLLERTVLAGLYCPTDAQANPFKVTQGYARAAQARGVEMLTGTTVAAIETEGERVSGVLTSRGIVRAKWVVNAAGAWSAAIGAMAGVKHDVLPRRGQLVVLEASEDMPAVGVSQAGMLLAKHAAPADAKASGLNLSLFYSSRAQSGTVLLGSTNELAGFDTRTTPDAIGGICAVAERVMPRLGAMRAVRSWAGLRPYSPGGPILGRAGGPEGYLVATGHGGDGMALAPITGLYLSELIARDGAACDLAEFLTEFVIPAKAGIQKTLSTGPRPSPG